MSRITLTLNPIEKNALSLLAEKEFRDPRSQAALIIRQELERRGLLPAKPYPNSVAADNAPSEGNHNADS